jgi:hypothetical protein
MVSRSAVARIESMMLVYSFVSWGVTGQTVSREGGFVITRDRPYVVRSSCRYPVWTAGTKDPRGCSTRMPVERCRRPGGDGLVIDRQCGSAAGRKVRWGLST